MPHSPRVFNQSRRFPPPADLERSDEGSDEAEAFRAVLRVTVKRCSLSEEFGRILKPADGRGRRCAAPHPRPRRCLRHRRPAASRLPPDPRSPAALRTELSGASVRLRRTPRFARPPSISCAEEPAGAAPMAHSPSLTGAVPASLEPISGTGNSTHVVAKRHLYGIITMLWNSSFTRGRVSLTLGARN